jgi:hypothetical protein
MKTAMTLAKLETEKAKAPKKAVDMSEPTCYTNWVAQHKGTTP